MLYSTLLVAASALAGFASAQQNTTSDTPVACCTVEASSIDADDREAMCNANENTCVELCGGQGKIASNGNDCDDTTLEFTCKCSNGTDISESMSEYQQSVPGQMCQIYWYQACIQASGSNAAQQRSCVSARESQCGNLTTDSADNSDDDSSSSASPSGSATGTSDSSSASATSSGGASSSSAAAAAAANLAVYGTPALAGGLLALFGLAL